MCSQYILYSMCNNLYIGLYNINLNSKCIYSMYNDSFILVYSECIMTHT